MGESETQAQRSSTLQDALLLTASIVLSLSAVAAPTWLDSGLREYGGLLPDVATGYEGYSALTAVLLFGVGILLGCLSCVSLPVLAMVALCPLPMWILVETFFGPEPSNIWPIALVISLLPALPTLLGAVLGRRLWKAAA